MNGLKILAPITVIVMAVIFFSMLIDLQDQASELESLQQQVQHQQDELVVVTVERDTLRAEQDRAAVLEREVTLLKQENSVLRSEVQRLTGYVAVLNNDNTSPSQASRDTSRDSVQLETVSQAAAPGVADWVRNPATAMIFLLGLVTAGVPTASYGLYRFLH